MAKFSDVFVFFVGSLHIAVILMIFSEVDKTQPVPYMDEIFHIPQAQQYCNGSFSEWDPKITTLPGLYLVSVGLLQPLSVLLETSLPDICTVTVLRAVNVLFALGCLFAIHHILRFIHQPQTRTEEMKVILTAVSLASFPLLYFFIFLYYTDVGSTFFLLLAYLFSLRGSHFVAAVMATDAILFRQTNIVWVVFMAGAALAQTMEADAGPNPPKSDNLFGAVSSAVQRVLTFLLSPSNILKLLGVLWPYALVAVGFATFIYINEGIVVGDRSNHQATLNFPQLFYFAAFTAGFALPYSVSPDKVFRFVRSLLCYPLTYLTIVGVMVIFIRYFTQIHPFLLADNRHVVFYLWHRIFMRHQYVKFALIPGYLFAGWTVRDSLSHKSELWQLAFFVCLLAATVPQQLLEFRYFILPYLVVRLHSHIQSYMHIVVEFMLYSVVNIGMFYLFLQKPFYWPNSPDVQRFLW